ncbi:hypothetical protein QAD02_003297 [Eretmocerus hayati]|uniref:Uncharacterized protein n=1 Tax=Eretmocerus hayati TaxID=131215 RepID=A0ACC2NLI4_9HYME|nr:hypothetical protein QAD02_003297 [Eretmocerus hayati]
MAHKEEIKKLNQKKGTFKGSVTNFKKFLEEFKNDPDQNTLNLSLRLEKFRTVFSSFDQILDELELLDEENAKSLSIERFEIEDDYLNIISEAERLISLAEKTSASHIKNLMRTEAHSTQSLLTHEPNENGDAFSDHFRSSRNQRNLDEDESPTDSSDEELDCANSRRVKLPQADLPTFTGRYED